MDITARSMALYIILVFLAGTLIGSLLPESGNVLASLLGLPAHIFNPLFLVIGIIGIVLALYLGLR